MLTTKTALLLVVALTAWATPSLAAKGDNNAPKPTRTNTAPKNTTNRSAAAPATRLLGGNTRLVQQRLQQRRSLIADDAPQPSPKVTQIIRERESSGPGWLGTAFLVSVLSRHDLSSSDRSWIQDRIDSIRSSGEAAEDGEPPALLPAVHPKIEFTFKGLDAPLHAGEVASVSVSALAHGQPVPITCDHPAASNHSGHVDIVWTPEMPSVSLLTCKSGERQERRLVLVVPKGIS
jgi:hypothetical protein